MSWVAAITIAAIGSTEASSPTNNRSWVTTFRMGVRSTTARPSLVVHAPLDEAELHEGEADHQEHQDDALGGGAGIVEAFEAVEEDLVDHELGRARRTALGHDVDD